MSQPATALNPWKPFYQAAGLSCCVLPAQLGPSTYMCIWAIHSNIASYKGVPLLPAMPSPKMSFRGLVLGAGAVAAAENAGPAPSPNS